MPYKDEEVRKQKSNERWLSWAQRNPELANERMRDWRHRNPKYMLHAAAKRRARNYNIEFDISIEYIPDIPKICPIALIPLFPRNDGNRGPIDNSPTLDRVDTTRGYIKDNIRVISHKGNRWKSDMTVEDVRRLLKYFELDGEQTTRIAETASAG